MKKFLMAMVALVLVSGVAFAGPNANGTLIVHNPGLDYSADWPYCGDTPLGMCADGVVNLDIAGGTGVWKVYAAFPEGSSPRLSGATFGVDYTAGNVYVIDYGTCGDFEIVDSGWPAQGTGVGMTFNEAQTGLLTELYWFAGYNYYAAPATFSVIAHPVQGGTFADDSVPPDVDTVTDYGVLGFDGGAGYLPCPEMPTEGACCSEFGDCTITPPDQCDGEWVGGECDPNPCPPLIGACCVGNQGDCFMLEYYECLQEGDWVGGPCDPNPCVIPTIDASWGTIKATYR